MCIIKASRLLAVGVVLSLVPAFRASTAQGSEKNSYRFDVAISYQAAYSNPVGNGANFWLQGGDAQMHAQFWHGLGAVADVSGLHNADVNASGVGLDLVTATFGPRYTRSIGQRPISLYGQALVGEAFGMNSFFPGQNGASSAGDDSLALILGGGVNYSLRRRFSLRVFQVDWVRTQLPNANSNVQNNLRLGAGFVLHIK